MALPALDKIKVHPGHCYLRATRVDDDQHSEEHLAQALIVSRISLFYQFLGVLELAELSVIVNAEEFYLPSFRLMIDKNDILSVRQLMIVA